MWFYMDLSHGLLFSKSTFETRREPGVNAYSDELLLSITPIVTVAEFGVGRHYLNN